MAARRETVWINTDIRKTLEFDALSAAAFRLWTRLPFLVDDQHRVPDLLAIASDVYVAVSSGISSGISSGVSSGVSSGEEDVARLLDELVAAGFVDALDDGARCMSALSRRFYSFSEPSEAGDGEVDA